MRFSRKTFLLQAGVKPLIYFLFWKPILLDLAVEYIHYVKKPMEQVKKLRQDIEQARRILKESNPGDEVSVPRDMEQLF
jgi:hypothetical protein